MPFSKSIIFILKSHEHNQSVVEGGFVFHLYPLLLSSLKTTTTTFINKVVSEVLPQKWPTGPNRGSIAQFVGLSQRCSILRTHKEFNPLLSKKSENLLPQAAVAAALSQSLRC